MVSDMGHPWFETALSVVRRQFVAQMGDSAALWHLSPELADFSDQGIDLFLLAKNGLVELLQPIFCETGFDF